MNVDQITFVINAIAAKGNTIYPPDYGQPWFFSDQDEPELTTEELAAEIKAAYDKHEADNSC